MALPRPIPSGTTRAALLAEITTVLDPKIATLTSQLATANQQVTVANAAKDAAENDAEQLRAEALILNGQIAVLTDSLTAAQAAVVDLEAYDSAFGGLLDVLAGRGLIVAVEEEEVSE